VEFRQALGFDSYLSLNVPGYSNVLNGVVVHAAAPSNANGSQLLDMNPSNTWGSAMALDVGQSYTDSTAGVTISTTGVSGSGATVKVTLATPSCVPANPAISISPSQSQWVQAGATVSFTVSVADNDNSSCSPASFNLGATVPSGWTGILGSSMLNVAPGASASTTLQVTSPSGTANGFYNVGVIATNAVASSYAASASATYVISMPLSLSITVAPNQSSYTRGQTVSITVALLSGGSPDVGVKLSRV